jgi:hypothetical protein
MRKQSGQINPGHSHQAIDRMRKTTPFLIAAGLIALAFLLNPSAEKHRDKIKVTIAERSHLERVLGIGQLTSFISKYHSFGLGSYTTVNEKVSSVGAFGMVFVTE